MSKSIETEAIFTKTEKNSKRNIRIIQNILRGI